MKEHPDAAAKPPGKTPVEGEVAAMIDGRPTSPAWLEWAEQQTIKLLRAGQEDTQEKGPASETDDLRIVHEIRLPDTPPRPPAPRPVSWERSNRLIIRVHRDNL